MSAVDINRVFANRVREQCAAADMEPSELARAAGIKPDRLAALLEATTSADVDEVAALARALGVDAQSLLTP